MRLSEFARAVESEFGPRGDSLVADLALSGLSYRTAAQALADGTDTREVWLALCAEADVPVSRRHGVGHLERRR
jgi:hypothetical protein